jgi:hypothetical protein
VKTLDGGCFYADGDFLNAEVVGKLECLRGLIAGVVSLNF